WELTSITSFLLIGINYWKKKSRRGALNALFVTAAGGLCLLAGLLLLAALTGSFSIVHFNHHGIDPGALATAAMFLILLGCWTKSAHFPFHFWLPQAMAAPTPISAYLHSATMVKAGIYLMLRLNPGMSDLPLWSPSIMFMGLLTFFVGGLLAISREDAKALLAYSTISQLGMITFMLGINTQAAVLGALFHILAHATFKGALFMGAGAIDHTLGTRHLNEIGPLKDEMPVTATVMALCGISMAGLFFSGFISKEAMFGGLFNEHFMMPNWRWGIVAGAAVASVFTFLYSMRFVFELPFGKARDQSTGHPHEVGTIDSFLMTASPVVLCAGTIGLGIGVSHYLAPVQKLINDIVLGIGHSVLHIGHGEHFHYHFALWHGFKKPLFVTGVVVLTGSLLYMLLNTMRSFWTGFFRIPGPETVNQIFQDNVVDVCHTVMDTLFINGPLKRYMIYILGFTLFVTFYTWLTNPELPLSMKVLPTAPLTDFYFYIPFILVSAVGLAILKFDRPVPAVIVLGSLGFLISTIYLVYKAPDLILTQISVETVSIVIFLWVLKDIDFPEDPESSFRVPDFLISLASSFGVMYILLQVLSTKQGLTDIARYYIANSLSKAWGHNMVNVILVDFRALDTMGEISVLAIATVGILAILKITFTKSEKGGA
ncbi:MAG: hydrogen gas-evolving membrane-bound hydrogenase subunit E, partial [bacterium]